LFIFINHKFKFVKPPMHLLKPYHYFLIISLLASLLVYRKEAQQHLYLRFFPPFLALTFVVEFWGSFMAVRGINNVIPYNIFFLQWVCFYLGFLSLIVTNRAVKWILWVMIPLYVIATTINAFYFQGMKKTHNVTIAFGCFLIVVFCIYYFLELFRRPKSVDLKSNPAFWICAGLLFYCCCAVPLYGLIELWINIKWIASNFDTIGNLLNIFLYILFTIGFLCLKTPKYSSSSS